MRAETAALELRLVKWIVGTGVAGAGLVIAALRQLGRGGPRTGSAVDRPRDTHEIARFPDRRRPGTIIHSPPASRALTVRSCRRKPAASKPPVTPRTVPWRR